MKLPAYQELSKEQDEINSLPLEASHLVTGPPGTGKTVMALYRTEMLTRQGAERNSAPDVLPSPVQLCRVGRRRTRPSREGIHLSLLALLVLQEPIPSRPSSGRAVHACLDGDPDQGAGGPATRRIDAVPDRGRRPRTSRRSSFCWRATWRAVSPYLPTRIRSSATTTRPSLKFVRTPDSPTRHTRCDGTTGTLGRSPSWPVASTRPGLRSA